MKPDEAAKVLTTHGGSGVAAEKAEFALIPDRLTRPRRFGRGPLEGCERRGTATVSSRQTSGSGRR